MPLIATFLLPGHTVLEGGRTKKKLTGAGIGAKFWRIMSRVTTKNLKIGLWGLFEKKRFLYFHLMAQMQIFGSKMQFFGPKSIFFRNHPFFWHHHDWTPKRQLFCVDPDARRASGQPWGPILGQKRPKSGPEAGKQPPERQNGHLPGNRSYPELPQDMGDIWSHWVGSVWPEKMGVI